MILLQIAQEWLLAYPHHAVINLLLLSCVAVSSNYKQKLKIRRYTQTKADWLNGMKMNVTDGSRFVP